MGARNRGKRRERGAKNRGKRRKRGARNRGREERGELEIGGERRESFSLVDSPARITVVYSKILQCR